MAKQDIYQVVTDRILEALDRGTVPWRNPISTGGLAFPTNLESGKPYRGINVFLLATTAMCEGYRSAYWLTFRQAKERGGNVRKGEKSTPIVFFKRLEVDDPDGKSDDGKKRIPMLKKYSVFNLEQIDGIEPPDAPDPSQDDEPRYIEPVAAADSILKGYVLPPTVETGGYRAYYRPATDTVKIPAVVDFEDAASHASTFFHELVHSTGHSKRLDRGLDQKLPDFGAPAYGKEELIAECGSAFLCATAGILPETIEQSAAYIDGWRKKIKGDKKLVVHAAAAAQRAVDHILGVTWDDVATAPANDTSPAKMPATDNPKPAPPPATTSAEEVGELRTRYRKMQTAMRVCPPPPSNLDLSREGDLNQLRHYAGLVQRWYAGHLDAWRDAGIFSEDPRRDWSEPMHPTGSDEQLKAALQSFPLPGQANLNSTATAEERSAYISAVLRWWNTHAEDWTDRGVLDHQKNPVVNPNPAPVQGNFPANVPGCGMGGT